MTLVLDPALVAAARARAGIGLREAARLLGCSRQTIRNTERGLSFPGSELLGRMAYLYGVSIDSLFIHLGDDDAINGTAAERESAAR